MSPDAPDNHESRQGKRAPGQVVIGFALPEELKEWLQERAKAEKRSLSNYLVLRLTEFRAAVEAQEAAEAEEVEEVEEVEEAEAIKRRATANATDAFEAGKRLVKPRPPAVPHPARTP